MNNKTAAGAWACLLGLACVAFAPPARAAENDEAGVRQAAVRFYAALNQLFTGDVRPMTEVWSHADDVTYMGPDGGFQVGWSDVLKNWEGQAAMKLGGKVEAVDLRVTAGQDLAVVSDVEKGAITDAKGGIQTVSIRATNIFRQEDGKWKMIGHHTDLLPYLAK